MTETGHREPTPEVKELARRWLVLSRMKKIPLASLAKHPDRLDALFRGALLAAANAVDNRAGLVNSSAGWRRFCRNSAAGSGRMPRP